MDYRTLGRTGVKVSPLCLGTMNFGDPTDETESIRIIHAAIDAGINFIDTANVYNDGVAEQFTGKALKDRRDRVVLATKVHGAMGEGPNDSGNSRYHILRQVEASLRRLQTDRIDLYQLHRPDPSTPMDEQIGALTDLVRQGKVLYIGTSTFQPWQICEALWMADRRRLERVVSEQPPYSLLSRAVEKQVLPFCRRFGLAVLPWSPLASGWLTGKYRRGEPAPSSSRAADLRWEMNDPLNQRRMEAVEKLMPLAQECGVSLAQFALAWLLAQPDVTAPIIGPRSVEQLDDNLRALAVRLPPELLKRVDELVPPRSDVMEYRYY